MKQLKIIILLMMISGCATTQQNADGTITSQPTFFGKCMHIVGLAFKGAADGVANAHNQPIYLQDAPLPPVIMNQPVAFAPYPKQTICSSTINSFTHTVNTTCN